MTTQLIDCLPGLCGIIKDMGIKDGSDKKWLSCVSTALVTLLRNLDTEKAHLESYISTLTVLICSSPPPAANVQTVSPLATLP